MVETLESYEKRTGKRYIGAAKVGGEIVQVGSGRRNDLHGGAAATSMGWTHCGILVIDAPRDAESLIDSLQRFCRRGGTITIEPIDSMKPMIGWKASVSVTTQSWAARLVYDASSTVSPLEALDAVMRKARVP